MQALEIIDTRWTIEGDPDAVWVWADREGRAKWLQPDNGKPSGMERTHIHTSDHEGA
jgi:hypothetical protein